MQIGDYVEVNVAEYPGTLKDFGITVGQVRGVCKVKQVNPDRGLALVTSLMRPRGIWVPLFALNHTTHSHEERRG